MPLLGSHLSIAGGYHKAVEAAAGFGMETVQIFTKNNNQWRAKELTDKDVEKFQAALEQAGLRTPCSHDSYLINLGSSDQELWEKSRDALIVELERAERLGLAGVVMHPGSHLKATPEEGLENIVRALDEVTAATNGMAIEIWLETTAGQGTNLGYKFEHLAYLLDHVRDKDRYGVCVDTCHIFAAGYPLKTKKEYDATMKEFDEHVGVDRIRAFHLNDSKKPLGSRVDRHEHIGEGELGLKPFEFVLNDKRFKDLPMYLETKKEKRDGVEMDEVNLATLRSLMK